MDVNVPQPYLPAKILTEDVEKIVIMKAALRSFTDDHERMLLSIQRRLKNSQDKIDVCVREYSSIELQLNAVETKISEAFLATHEAELEALQTLKENRAIKRKIIELKSDMEVQQQLVKRARRTIHTIRTNKSRKQLRQLLPKPPP